MFPESEDKDYRIVEQAKKEVIELFEQTKDVIAKSYYWDSSANKFATDSVYAENLHAVLVKYSNLVERYADNPKAWSAIREYLKVATLEDFPDILNEAGDETSLYGYFRAANSSSTNSIAELISVLLPLFLDNDVMDNIKSLKKRIVVQRPKISKTLFEYDSTEKSLTISGFDDSLMTQSGTVSATEKGSYYVTFSLKDQNTYCWDNNLSSDWKVSWKISDAPADFLPSVVINCADKKESVYTGENVNFVPVTTVPAGAVLSYSLDEGATYSASAPVFKNPGAYRVLVKAEYNGYKTGVKTVTVTIKDALDAQMDIVKQKIKNTLLADALSLEWEVAANSASSYENSDISFYRFLVSSGIVNDSNKNRTAYLYLDMFSPLFLNEICNCFKELIPVISLNGSCTKFSSAYAKYFNGITVDEPPTLEEFAAAFASGGVMTKFMNDFDTNRLYPDKFESFKNADEKKTLLKIFNIIFAVDDFYAVAKEENTIETLDWLIKCIKAGLMFEENLYKLTEDGALFSYSTASGVDFVYSTGGVDTSIPADEQMNIDRNVFVIIKDVLEALKKRMEVQK